MKTLTLGQNSCLYGLVLLTACAKEPPPVSVQEFMDSPRLLEATMVRCGQNRAEMKYEAECANARAAVNRLEVREKEARKAELEARSERKREALRRTQQAAAEARRRAAESQQQREAAEYLGLPEGRVEADPAAGPAPHAPPPAESNVPGVTIAPPEPDEAGDAGPPQEPEAATSGDLQSIREELQRRNEEPQQ